jgi:hypothetical protein
MDLLVISLDQEDHLVKEEKIEEKGEVAKFSITLLIMHPNADPSNFTKELRMKPFSIQKAGEQVITPKGNKINSFYKESRWNHVNNFKNAQIDFQVRKMCNKLHSKKSNLRKISDAGAQISLFVNLPGSSNQGTLIEPTTLKKLSDMNIYFGFEIFPTW